MEDTELMAVKAGGDNGCAILPYEYPISEAWGITLNENIKEDVKKPAYYTIRKIIQAIINYLTKLKGEK